MLAKAVRAASPSAGTRCTSRSAALCSPEVSGGASAGCHRVDCGSRRLGKKPWSHENSARGTARRHLEGPGDHRIPHPAKVLALRSRTRSRLRRPHGARRAYASRPRSAPPAPSLAESMAALHGAAIRDPRPGRPDGDLAECGMGKTNAAMGVAAERAAKTLHQPGARRDKRAPPQQDGDPPSTRTRSPSRLPRTCAGAAPPSGASSGRCRCCARTVRTSAASPTSPSPWPKAGQPMYLAPVQGVRAPRRVRSTRRGRWARRCPNRGRSPRAPQRA